MFVEGIKCLGFQMNNWMKYLFGVIVLSSFEDFSVEHSKIINSV